MARPCQIGISPSLRQINAKIVRARLKSLPAGFKVWAKQPGRKAKWRKLDISPELLFHAFVAITGCRRRLPFLTQNGILQYAVQQRGTAVLGEKYAEVKFSDERPA